MKKIFLVVVMLGVLRSISARAQNQQSPSDLPQTAEGQVLAKVMGVWQKQAASKDATEPSADHQINKWSLNNRWLEGHVKSSDGTDDAMVMTTYDMDRKAYVAYLFTPGGLSGKFLGKFDADTQEMSWIDRNEKGTTTSLERLTDPNTLDVKGSVRDSDGKTLKQWTEHYTRTHDDIDKAAGSSKEQEFQESAEGEVLARYIGQWHSVLVFRGREKQIDYDTTWALRGRWLYAKINSSDAKESLVMSSYDSTQQAYAAWSFSSDGSVEAWKGTWDDSACRMSWTHQNAKGGVSDVDQFIDDDTIEITSKNHDSAGTTVFEANEHVKRK